MTVNCPNCGSAIKDNGKFCSYCGAKLPDDTKRVEIQIDNIAEVKRAEYEEKESQLRQKKMERDLRREKRKPYFVLAKVLSIVIPIGLALTGWLPGIGSLVALVVGVLFLFLWFFLYLPKL